MSEPLPHEGNDHERPDAEAAAAVPEAQLRKGAVAWMARNPVAANLLMAVLIVGGAVMATQLKQEVFPEFDLDVVTISVPYPGASPSEVEQGIVLAVEEAVRGVDGIKRVTSVANESMASVRVEIELGYDTDRVANDIKSAVDRITSLPGEAERPVVALLSNRREVVSLMIYGQAEERVLRDLAERVRRELLDDPGITQVDVDAVRRLEIHVEVDQASLRRYGLTLEQVATAIRRSAVELPGGAIKTRAGEILVRTAERRDEGREFADIPVIARPDGSTLRLRDVATIRDGFEESDAEVSFDGQPSSRVRVFRVGEQTPISVSEAVKAYVERAASSMPPGVKIAVWRDDSEIYRGRIDLLMRNAQLGLILVLVVLGLFLEIRLAFWVTMGIPISFLGSMVLMPALGVSFNMVSLFAFIITLGMVVDDAIVVGENVYHMRQNGVPPMRAAILGAKQVGVPVTFSILTTVAAFLPLLFVPGFSGKIFRVIPAVVISVLVISLVESLFVLPAHLGHMRRARGVGLLAFVNRQQGKVSGLLEWFIDRLYSPALRVFLEWRYAVVAAGVAALVASVGAVAGGRLEFAFLPRVESDVVSANAALPFGSPVERTEAVRERLVAAAQTVLARHGGDKVKRGLFAAVGSATERGGARGGAAATGSHLASAQVFLVPSDQREVSAQQFAKEWREEVGPIAGVDTLTFTYSNGPSGGQPIDVELTHPSMDVLEMAAGELAGQLASFSGVKDIDDGFSAGKPQLDFRILPAAASLGLTASDVGRQLRSAFFGVEALRQQRGRDEVRVMVRLPESERVSEHELERMLLRAPNGTEIPLYEAAEADRGRSYTSIRRVDGKRSVSVNADVVPGVASPDKVNSELKERVLPELMARYAGLGWSFAGERRERTESLAALGQGYMVALLLIFALLAIPFRSYVQPIVVMTAIPFGIVGAVAGHLAMGIELSIISMMGIVALSGVVVNDSLVLVDAANRRREEGASHFDAIAWAGARRFRPILLTSLTTFLGLAPMIFETSVQARFLIPMAVSLGFGILFATVIVLVLVPAFYLLVEDIRALYQNRTVHDPAPQVRDHDEEDAAPLPTVG
ncbi:MAG: hypothetical protein RIT45_2231 [Pseudomonadota bacterium]|jgi:multidrug efflux pump subunit AcrB